MSNEHPVMNGNWVDAPHVCGQCGRLTSDADICEIAGIRDFVFCSRECSDLFLLKRIDVLEDICLRLLCAWNNGAFIVANNAQSAVFGAFNDLRTSL